MTGIAGGLRLPHVRRDGLRVQGVHEDDVDLLVHHLLELATLLVLARLGVGVDDLALAVGEGGDLLLDDGVVEALEACGVLVGQEQTHRDVVALLRRRGAVAAADSVDDAARGEGQRGRRGGQGCRETTYGDSTKDRSAQGGRLSSVRGEGEGLLWGSVTCGVKWLPGQGGWAPATAAWGDLGAASATGEAASAVRELWVNVTVALPRCGGCGAHGERLWRLRGGRCLRGG